LIPRKSRRFTVQLRVSFSQDQHGHGIVYNLSVDGCQIESISAVKEGDQLALFLYSLSMSLPSL